MLPGHAPWSLCGPSRTWTPASAPYSSLASGTCRICRECDPSQAYACKQHCVCANCSLRSCTVTRLLETGSASTCGGFAAGSNPPAGNPMGAAVSLPPDTDAEGSAAGSRSLPAEPNPASAGVGSIPPPKASSDSGESDKSSTSGESDKSSTPYAAALRAGSPWPVPSGRSTVQAGPEWSWRTGDTARVVCP